MKIAYDTKLMKVGCSIVQAGLGGTHGIEQHFDVDDWIVHLTPDMKVYEVTSEQLQQLVQKTEAAR